MVTGPTPRATAVHSRLQIILFEGMESFVWDGMWPAPHT